MKIGEMKTHRELMKEAMKDPAYRAAYDALEPEYLLAVAAIEKRLKKKMTQASLAKKIGTKQSAIARLESGTSNPSIKFLKKVSTALGGKLKVTL
jgi:ribosome-binding protein aMBF1 (putative translation factor)